MAKAEVLGIKTQRALAARQKRVKQLQQLQLKRQQRLAARKGKRLPPPQKQKVLLAVLFADESSMHCCALHVPSCMSELACRPCCHSRVVSVQKGHQVHRDC